MGLSLSVYPHNFPFVVAEPRAETAGIDAAMIGRDIEQRVPKFRMVIDDVIGIARCRVEFEPARPLDHLARRDAVIFDHVAPLRGDGFEFEPRRVGLARRLDRQARVIRAEPQDRVAN